MQDTQEVKRIEEYNLLDFMLSAEKAIKDGWSVSTDNDKYPQNIGGWYSTGLVKVGLVEDKSTVIPMMEDNSNTTPMMEPKEQVGTRGRKKNT